jgi:F-type H+-transporting ATPase subunit b
MDLNATFIGQIIVFLVLLWFLARFVVPPLTKANSERQKKIAEGLAAGEAGQKELLTANERAGGIVREARERARQIDDEAQRRMNETVQAAKQLAQTEGARIVEAARAEVGNEALRARDQLRREFGTLVVEGAARLLEREVDARTHAQLLEQLERDIVRD